MHQGRRENKTMDSLECGWVTNRFVIGRCQHHARIIMGHRSMLWWYRHHLLLSLIEHRNPGTFLTAQSVLAM